MCTHINMLFAVTVNISSEAPCNDFKYLILVYIKKQVYQTPYPYSQKFIIGLNYFAFICTEKL